MSKKAPKGASEKEVKRPFGAKVASFWRTHILRKKEEEQTSSGGTASSISSEEKNKLVAEAATSGLRLDEKTREQVAKVLASEMQRRHLERERRRNELMASTRAQLPWGKKAPVKKELAPKPSPGGAVYPIKMVPKSARGRETGVTADLDDWKPVPATAPSSSAPVKKSSPVKKSATPVPAASQGPSLEDQRKKFLERSMKQGSQKTQSSQSAKMKSSPSQSKMLAGPPVSTVSSNESSSSSQGYGYAADAFGSQPMELQLDDSTVQEIHSHTFEKMLQNILHEAKQTGGSDSGKQVKAKDPQDMTPEELVELLKSDPNAWDQLTRQNTIVSFGVTAATNEDKDRGSKVKKNRHATIIKFESEVDVACVPVGKDFASNERKEISKTALKK